MGGDYAGGRDYRRDCALADVGRFPPAGSVAALRRGFGRGVGVRGGGMRQGGWAPGTARLDRWDPERGGGRGGRPVARACPHCAEGATEATAGLKVVPPAKVARGPALAAPLGGLVAFGITIFSNCS